MMRYGIMLGLTALSTAVLPAAGQTISPQYDCGYEWRSLGRPGLVTGSLGGLVFSQDDPDVLLIGGNANQPSGAIYSVRVLRDANGRITGFDGDATLFASAPNIDGGLTYAPGGVLLFSRYSMNEVGQILPGETTPARSVALNPLGFSSSVGALTIVPDGFPGAGRLKVFPFNSSRWHDAELTPDGMGTFDISPPTNSIQAVGGPEGIVYLRAGSVLFPEDTILISEYSLGSVSAYDMDANGDIVPGTRRLFMSGLSGAEGATFDPVTGDFLFSEFASGGRVLAVSGFNPDCVGNFNLDCVVDFFDVQAFLDAFSAGDPSANVNGDDSLDFFDVLAFLDDLASGCL